MYLRVTVAFSPHVSGVHWRRKTLRSERHLCKDVETAADCLFTSREDTVFSCKVTLEGGVKSLPLYANICRTHRCSSTTAVLGSLGADLHHSQLLPMILRESRHSFGNGSLGDRRESRLHCSHPCNTGNWR